MQEYNDFMCELRGSISHIGQRLTKDEAARRLSTEQAKKLRAPCFMTSEFVECRALAGYDKGPLVAEITHGIGMGGGRVIGLTVFHVLPEYADCDHDQSGLQCSIGEAVARLRELNGG
jgi:hypothetical protein